MEHDRQALWLAAGLRTAFAHVDGPFSRRDSLALSVPVVRAMGKLAAGPIDFAVWGSVALNLAYSNLAREVWFDAKLDPHVPAFTTVMQCSTSMVGVFEAAGMLGGVGRELALVGGVDSMSRIQFGLGQNLSDWLRRVSQARKLSRRLRIALGLRPSDIRLYVPKIQNRVTGRSMGEHCEDMAKTWAVSRREQDEWALLSHRRAVAAQDRGFFSDLVLSVDGLAKDEFPRRDTSLEKLAKLKPAFDRGSGRGTITAGNSSPLTDGAAGIWIATQTGLARLPADLPRVRLVDFELAAIDVFSEGLLMAPVSAIPRLLSRYRLKYADIALWEIHEAFSAQLACHIKGLQDRGFVRAKTGIDEDFGSLPLDLINPNGGSVALGHPFGATGARILSQAVKELAAMPKGSRAIVSICADGGLGTVALLER
jgi:acetyl-CoA C-acetyltransferase